MRKNLSRALAKARKIEKIAIVPLLTVLACLCPLSAQENPTSTTPLCLTSGETVYRPGVKGVKPPQLQPNNKDKSAPDLRGPFSLELLVLKVIYAIRDAQHSQRMSAEKARKYISENWRFKPATKQAKPVAVRLTMNFGPR